MLGRGRGIRIGRARELARQKDVDHHWRGAEGEIQALTPELTSAVGLARYELRVVVTGDPVEAECTLIPGD